MGSMKGKALGAFFFPPQLRVEMGGGFGEEQQSWLLTSYCVPGSEGGARWQPSIHLHTLKEFWPLGAAAPPGKPHSSLLFVSLEPQRSGPGGTFSSQQ